MIDSQAKKINSLFWRKLYTEVRFIITSMIQVTVVNSSSDTQYRSPTIKLQDFMLLCIMNNNNFCICTGATYHWVSYLEIIIIFSYFIALKRNYSIHRIRAFKHNWWECRYNCKYLLINFSNSLYLPIILMIDLLWK